MISRILPALIAAFLWTASGCSHYQIESVEATDTVRVFVAPVQTATFVPRIGADLSRQVREAFAADPRIQLAASPSDASHTLRLTVRDYRQTTLAGFSGDTGKPASVEERVRVDLEIVPRSGKTLEASVEGAITTYARESGSFQEARFQSGASLQYDLAARIRDRFLDQTFGLPFPATADSPSAGN